MTGLNKILKDKDITIRLYKKIQNSKCISFPSSVELL